MKVKLFLLVFVISISCLYSQNINGSIKDSLTNIPLAYVNITFLQKDKGTYTKEYGKFEIDISNELNDTLFITSVGYKSKKIAVSSIKEKHLNIFLHAENEIIDEVVLNVKRKKISSKLISITSSKKTKFASSVPFGSQIAYLLENEKNKIGRLKEISFFVKYSKNETVKLYPSYLRLKFYAYDKINDSPSKLLSFENILIKPKKGDKKITVNIEDKLILLPLEGVCVVLEVVNASKPTKNRLYKANPSLLWTHNKYQKTWMNYRGKKWKKKRQKSVFKTNLYPNLLINAKVYY